MTKLERVELIEAIEGTDWSLDTGEDEGKDNEILFYRWNNELDREEWMTVTIKMEQYKT